MAIALDRYGNLERPLGELAEATACKIAIEAENEDFLKLGKQKVRSEVAREPRFDGLPSLTFLIRALETPGISGVAAKREAAETLGKLGLRQAIGPLVKALGDGYWMIREAAAQAITKIEPDRGVQVFIQALQHKNWRACKEAALMLGELGDKKALQPLSYWAFRDVKVMVRRAAVKAIGEIGGEEAKIILVKLLSDEAKSVAEEAKRALTKLASNKDNDISQVNQMRGGDLDGFAFKRRGSAGGPDSSGNRKSS